MNSYCKKIWMFHLTQLLTPFSRCTPFYCQCFNLLTLLTHSLRPHCDWEVNNSMWTKCLAFPFKCALTIASCYLPESERRPAIINHSDRCRLQTQQALNALEPWACGCMSRSRRKINNSQQQRWKLMNLDWGQYWDTLYLTFYPRPNVLPIQNDLLNHKPTLSLISWTLLLCVGSTNFSVSK